MHLYHIHLHAFQHIYASLHRTWTKIGHYPDLKKKTNGVCRISQRRT